jgi:hypothetical protein
MGSYRVVIPLANSIQERAEFAADDLLDV